MLCKASEIPGGATVTQIGSLHIPRLACEIVQADQRAEMNGWVDITLWVDGPHTMWVPLPSDNPTAFLGMVAISVPGSTLCTYEE